MTEVLLTDRWTRPACIFDKFLHRHLLFLFRVVGVSREHDNRVSQWEELIYVVVMLAVGLVEGEGELPDDSLDLLGFPGQPEFAK